MSIVSILFILWGIVFAMWLAQQFSRYNKAREKRKSSTSM